jgi:hypothetical protein
MRLEGASRYFQDFMLGMAGAAYEAAMRPVDPKGAGWLDRDSPEAQEAERWFNLACSLDTNPLLPEDIELNREGS